MLLLVNFLFVASTTTRSAHCIKALQYCRYIGAGADKQFPKGCPFKVFVYFGENENFFVYFLHLGQCNALNNVITMYIVR